MATKGRTVIVLDIDDKGAVRQVQSLDRESTKAIKGLGSIGRVGSSSFLAVGAAAGGALVVVGTFTRGIQAAVSAINEAVRSTANLQDETAKNARRLGVSVQLLSELRLAAQLGGTDIEKLGVGLRVLAKNAFDTAQGTGEAKDSFDQLGVSVVDNQGRLKSQRELLLDVADRFAQMEDGTLKTALAQRIFGRSGTELIPVLNEGRSGLQEMNKQARELGITFDEQTAAKAEQFNDQLTTLRFAAEGVSTRIGVELIPVLVALFETLFEDERAMRAVQEAASDLGRFLAGTAISVSSLTAVVAGNAAAIFRILDRMGRAGIAGVPGLTRLLGDFEGLREEIALLEGIEATATNAAINMALSLRNIGREAGDASRNVFTFNENLNNTISLIKQVPLPTAGPSLFRKDEFRRQGFFPGTTIGRTPDFLPQVDPEKSIGSIFGSFPSGTIRKPESLGLDPGRLGRTPDFLPQPQAPEIGGFQTFSDELGGILGNLTDKFGAYQVAILAGADAWQQFVTGQVSGGEAVKRASVSVVAGLSKQFFTFGVSHLAMAIAALTNPVARGTFGPPGPNFKASAMFFSIAAGSGAASAALSSGQPGGGVGPRGNPFNPAVVEPARPQVFDVNTLRAQQGAPGADLSAQVHRLGSAVASLEGRLGSMSPEDVVTVASDRRGGLSEFLDENESRRIGALAAGGRPAL